MGRPRRFTHPLDPLVAVCMIYAPFLLPAHAPASHRLRDGWEWHRGEIGSMGRLWDASAALVPPCGCPPAMLVLR
eukprot:364096-Chlamydomonas_euryale.AAC.5